MKNKLIRANDLYLSIRDDTDINATHFARFKEYIEEAPAVDAVEVVHCRWLYDSGSGRYFCPSCDEYALSFKKDTLYGGDLYEVCLTDYCPNCGAKMMN